jgi:hypothetical protein
VYVDWDSSTSYYLAAFHTISDFDSRYTNYLMKLSAVQPYTPVAVSTVLPMITKDSSCASFASGLAIKEKTVYISYGSCDLESRILVLGKSDLDSFFQ